MRLKVKIKPLTFKMRHKVNQHGPWWWADSEAPEMILSTLNRVHNHLSYSYSVRATVGVDVEILESKWVTED